MEAIFPFLLDVSTKSAAIVAAALLFCMAARRGSAALRHLVGALAMTGVVAMPLLSVALPAWHIGWFDTAVQSPQAEPHGSVAAPHAQPIPPSVAAVPPHEHPSSSRETSSLPVGGVDAAPAPSIAPAPATTVLEWPLWAVTSYLLGLGFMLARCVGGALAVRRLIGASRTITEGPWLETLAQVRTGGARVRLLECPDLPIPATCGLVRPVILLPPGSRNWPAEQRRLILLHELAHVRRRDGVWQLMGQLACALYWFNPLVWLVDQQVSLDRERACDDAVLTAEKDTAPADYAQTLLEIAKHLHRTLIPQGVIPMARTSQLQPRVKSVLDGTRNRRCVTGFRAAAVTTLSALLLVPLSVITASDVPRPEGETFVVTLPTGTNVELIGVSHHPAKKQSWWRADGSELTAAPYDQYAGGRVQSSGVPYEMAVRMSGPPLAEGAEFAWSAVGATGWTSGKARKSGENIEGLHAAIANLPADAVMATVRISYADGPWQTVGQSQGDPLATEGPSGAGIMWGPALETGGGVAITVSYTKSLTIGRDWRIVAVDQDGRNHPMDSRSGVGAADVIQWTVHFSAVPRARISGFRLQTRPYRVYEFRNVSLRPGVKTDVQVVPPEEPVASGRPSDKGLEIPASGRIGLVVPSGPRVPASAATDAYPHEISGLQISELRAGARSGDQIEITEVRGTKPDLVLGGTYRIRGRYILASKDQAKLAVFVTATQPGEGRTEVKPGEQIVVQRGSGDFELVTTFKTSAGFPHISFYTVEGGVPFADLYFGQEGFVSHPAIHKKAGFSSNRGAVRPARRVDLIAPVDQVVTAVHVQETQQVKAGDVLVQLDDRAQQSEVQIKQQEFMYAQAQLTEANEAVEAVRKLVTAKAASDEELRRLTAQAQTARTRVAVAQEQLAAEKLRLERYQIKAPFDGEVSRIYAQKNARLRTGDIAATVSSRKVLEAEFHLPATVMGQLQVGRVYLLSAGAPIDRQLRGTLTMMSRDIDAASGTVRSLFTIENQDLKLPSGFVAGLMWPQPLVPAHQ